MSSANFLKVITVEGYRQSKSFNKPKFNSTDKYNFYMDLLQKNYTKTTHSWSDIVEVGDVLKYQDN